MANETLGKGRRTSMSVTGADFTQWTYDARGRVTSENKQITGGGQFVTAFTYNDADLPVTMTYPDGEVVTFGYNNNMLPVSVSGTDTYAQTIAYDSANRMIQMIRGANKIDTVFTYNNWNVDNGRLQNITSTQVSTGDPLQNLTYDYDSVSNIETIVDSLSGPQTQAFTYDALDRLTNSSVTGGSNGLYTEGYTYEDPNNPNTGNLFSKNGVTYTYSTTHKHAVTSLSNGNTYGYDQNGNMTSRHVFEGTEFKDYTLNYDADREAPLWGNRLVSVTGAAAASFVYDGDGKQIKATVNGITAVYVGNHYEVKNGVVTKYYFAGSARIAVRKDGTLNFLLSDHLGSSSVTTDANGAKTASALYKAFGETRYTDGNLNTDYKFTGQREEASLGIYFFNARWYDGSLGRFLSPDTIVPTSTQGTQAWDRYAFVNNNPVRYNDPTGHMSCEEDGYCPEEEGTTPPPPPPTCTTVTCEALNGNVGAIIDFLIPSHIGFRWQLEVSGSIGGIIGIGPSGTLGLNVAYNRKSEEFAAFADLTGEGGVGAGSPLGASVTTGPLVGWGSSTVSDIATGDSAVLSGTVAPDLAVSFSGSAPLEGYSVSDPLNFENANLHVDPVYGQVPATLYGGGGIGGYYAGGGGGISHVFASAIIDLSPLFPWNW